MLVFVFLSTPSLSHKSSLFYDQIAAMPRFDLGALSKRRKEATEEMVRKARGIVAVNEEITKMDRVLEEKRKVRDAKVHLCRRLDEKLR